MEKHLPPGSYITAVEIDQLFGETDVKIHLDPRADPRLLIIYGQNGSGKTTILEVIHSLLSPEDNKGHRSRISQIPFSKASVTLAGGIVVEAKKREGLIGSYDWIIKKPGSDPLFMLMKSTHGSIKASNWDAEQSQRHSEMLEELQSIVGRVVSLDDKRTFYVQEERGTRIVESRMSDGRITHVLASDEAREDDNDPVYIGLNEIVSAIRREALLLFNRGSQGAQSIYTTLINKILSSA